MIDLNSNDNIGFPFFGGYKEILVLDVTIMDSSNIVTSRPIFPGILKEIQYIIISLLVFLTKSPRNNAIIREVNCYNVAITHTFTLQIINPFQIYDRSWHLHYHAKECGHSYISTLKQLSFIGIEKVGVWTVLN